MFFKNSVDVVYLIFAAVFLSTILMLIIELGGMKVFVKLLAIPRHIMLPCITMVCMIGAYTSNNTIFSMGVLFAFGIIGYLLQKFKMPQAPLIIGFVLGTLVETYLRRGLQMSKGSIISFFQAPISGVILSIGIAFVLFKIVSAIVKATKKKAKA